MCVSCLLAASLTSEYNQYPGQCHLRGKKINPQYTRPGSDYDLPVISILVYCKSSIVAHTATEEEGKGQLISYTPSPPTANPGCEEECVNTDLLTNGVHSDRRRMDGPKLQEKIPGRFSASRENKSFSKSLAGKKEFEFQFVNCNTSYLDFVHRKDVSSEETNEIPPDNDNIVNQCNGNTNKELENSNCLSEKSNTNGLDSRTSKIKQIVEDAISKESKQTVTNILEQVNALSTSEKLFLYLTLPTGKPSNFDPLRQPLNPLGSRFEIHQTIRWIKTHLEEDQDVSLPKQDVYDEYIAYCNSNAMKPLSTADFGKVMKQVFSRVRPRRLGTRGNSRYCYSGLRKKLGLDVPLLPDLGEDSKPLTDHCSTEEMNKSVSYLIREWAEKLLSVKFDSLQDLACYLVQHTCVDSFSGPAFNLAFAMDFKKTGEKGMLTSSADRFEISHEPHVAIGCPTVPLTPPVQPPVQTNKHRETQLQLQRKLQERVVIREQKRRLQEQQIAPLCNNTPPEKIKCKRAKLSNGVSNKVKKSLTSKQISLTVIPTSEHRSFTTIAKKVKNDTICDKRKPSTITNENEQSLHSSSGTNIVHSEELNKLVSNNTCSSDLVYCNSSSSGDSYYSKNSSGKLCSKTSLLDEFVDINTTSFDSSGELVIDTSELEQEVEGKSSPTDSVLKTQLSSSEDILHKGKIVSTRRKSVSATLSRNFPTDSSIHNNLGSTINMSKPVSDKFDSLTNKISSGTFIPVQERSTNASSLSPPKKMSPINDGKPSPVSVKAPQVKNTPIDVLNVSTPNTANKLPIPRLSNSNKPLTNLIILPPVTATTILQQSHSQKSSQKKYKLIQPKPQDEITKGKTKPNSDKVVARKPVNLLAKDTNANCDKEDSVENIVSTNTNLTEMNTEHSSEVTGNTANSNEAVKNGTNDVSIGCLEKDALNDYFHGGNNSQEPEEELMRYFQHHNSPCNEEVYEAVKKTLSNSEDISKGTSFTVKSDELSQLRLLLERNLKPVPSQSKNLYRHVDVERSTTTTPSQIPASSNSSLLMEGHKDVYNLASGMNTSQLPLAASASLSLLSRRSQQHNRKPSLHLQSLLTGNHGSSLANKRRVSFETPMVEHYQDGSNSCTVPPNPNTSSFTPISPGPYSPVGVHRVSSNSKPSSANASPFVSPRNTPVPRSRHNFSQANLPLSSSYIISSGNSVQGGTNTNRSRRSTAAKIVRSNSVNSHNISSQYQVPRPRAMSPNASLLKSHLADQSNERIFVAPGNLSSEVNVQLPSVANLRQSFMDTSLGRFPPVSPVSTSAPHSPMLHYHQSTLMNSNNNEQEMSVGIPSDTLPDQSVLPQDDPDHVSNTMNNASLFGVDSLSQEVSQIFQDGSSDQKNLEALWNALPNSSQYRSQSVPLHRMMSASAMISPQSTQPSPLYMGQQQAFNFNTFSSSATSSVAPTPVPSEFMDFVSIDDNSVAASNLLDGETGETEGLNPESLKQFLNILDTAQQEQSNQEQANIAMSIDESGLDIQTQCQPRLLQPSRSYPNTPLPYKSTVLGDHFNTAMEDNSTKLISLSYPSTPMLGHSTFDNNDDLAENETASINQITLNALNSRQGDFGAMVGFSARRNINLLLEEASTLSVEDELPLEPFDTFSQLVHEVNVQPDSVI
uniref:RFX-type winged-helix domain-containing protein n=1 Tax=Timema douglasi TaxID=61478 RepID=A0A7R8Z7E1_TIMDO|nr:unnamed protein product [Timema douglasi]